MEKATFRTADHVVSTNASYAEIAMRRGGKASTDVTVVRTGPDEERLRRRAPVPALRRGRRHLVAYIGVMGPQDGVDLAVRAAAHVVHDLGRDDIAFTFMGAGDCYDEIVALRDELGLQDYLELPGRVPDETVVDVLSTAAVGLSPDPKNPLNDVSTMNKTLEYMAFGLPVVAFDLKETRVSAGEAASYVASGDVAAYARAIVELLDDDDSARSWAGPDACRIEEELGWSYQREAYVGVYDRWWARPLPADSSSSGAGLTCAGLLEHFSSPTELGWCGRWSIASATAGRTRAGCTDMSPQRSAPARRIGGCRSSTCRLRRISRSSRTACT